jgi:hypothetical protein
MAQPDSRIASASRCGSRRTRAGRRVTGRTIEHEMVSERVDDGFGMIVMENGVSIARAVAA